MAGQNILEMRGIQKRFGEVRALADVDFDLKRGEVHALLGVNGAGKSTLIKILSGVYTKDDGTIEIGGQRYDLGSPRAAIEAGIAVVQQHPELVGDLTGAENIFLGNETRHSGLFGRIDRADIHARAARLLERFPVEVDLNRPVRDLSAVDREAVAILHALLQEHTRILILDEPTSTLTEREKGALFSMMEILRDQGLAIIYITHHLDEVFRIADRFTVFRGGRKVATHPTEAARSGEVSIPQLMLDRVPGEIFPPRGTRTDGDLVLEVTGLTREGEFEDVSFSVRKGEIMGIFGLVGSGLSELSKALFGVLRPDAGDMRLHGKPVRFRSPADALRNRVFLVPGDRRSEGLTLQDDVIFNTTLANLDRASTAGLLKFGSNRRTARELAGRVDLQPPILTRPLASFSGGNQQKVVISKGLFRQADLYIFVEPTVGVDIGARAKIYGLMRELSQDAGVLVMSSDGDEVHGVADRMFSLYKGMPMGTPLRDMSHDALLNAGIMGRAS